MNDQHDHIELYKLKLSEETHILAEDIIKDTDTYLSKFNISSSFSFSKTNLTELENNYMNFLMTLSPKISKLTSLNAELASLIIAADKAKKIETTLLLQKRFDAFCIFEKALYEYTSSIDQAFENGKISTSFIIASTQKFKISMQFLLNENT